MKNFKVVGLGKTKVNSVKSQFTENTMTAVVDIEIPNVFIEGLYKGEGRYTAIRYQPKGYFNLTACE